jgi:hypothetical protein
MTREQIIALGYPEGRVTDLALKLAKHMQRKGYPQRGLKVTPMDDDVITTFLKAVKKVPALHTHYSYTTPVHNLAHAWLTYRRELVTDTP